MYLHLGSDYVVPLKEVIAIVNIDPPIPTSLKEIIELAVAERKMQRVGDCGKEKSLILTETYAYLSPISSTTLFKRSRGFYEEV